MELFIILSLCIEGISGYSMLSMFSLSGCTKDNYQCRNAKINSDRMLKRYNPKVDDIERICVRDIKEDVNVLYDVLFQILDNPMFQMTGQCKGKMTTDDGSGFETSRERLVVFTYLSFELTRIASSMLLPNEVVLLSITDRPMYPSYYLEHSHSFYSYQASLGKEMHKKENIVNFVNQTPVDNFVVLDLDGTRRKQPAINEGCKRADSSAFCFYVDQYPNSCFQERHININNDSNSDLLKETVYYLENEHYNFIVLDGSSDRLGRFSAITNRELYLNTPFFFGYVQVVNDRNWNPNKRFSSHNLEFSYRNGNLLLNFPGAMSINKFVYYLQSASQILVYDKAIWEGFRDHKRFSEYLRNVGIQHYFIWKFFDPGFVNGSVMGFNTWSRIPVLYRSKMVNLVLQNTDTYLAALEQGKARSYIEEVSFNTLKRQDYFNPTRALNERKMCNDSKPICGKGRFLRHGHSKSINWTRSYGWFCQECPQTFFKDTIGNGECTKCSYPLQVNSDQSRCFDPYALEYLTIDSPFSVSWLAFSSMQFVFILATMSIFVTKRNTPIVLSSIKELTAIQLSFQLLLTVALPILFIGEVNKEICYSRPIVVGISLSILISVMLSKTQKVVIVFNKKVRVSSKEKFITNTIEWFIILIVLIVDSLILFVSYANQNTAIGTIFIYDDVRLVKHLSCNNNSTLLTQLLFTLFLVFVNCIQAYRARNLPSHYKEVIYVIYSSFISAVVLVVMTTIYYLQSNPLFQEIVMLIVAGTLNLINFALIFFYKVYVIVFCPQLNTKKAFNEKRKLKMEAQFEKSMRKTQRKTQN